MLKKSSFLMFLLLTNSSLRFLVNIEPLDDDKLRVFLTAIGHCSLAIEISLYFVFHGRVNGADTLNNLIILG